MLELACGKALGVHVGQLLELERPLQGHRVAHVASQEQEGAAIRQLSPQGLDPVLLGVEKLLDLGRDLSEVAQVVGHLVRPLVAPQLGEVQAQQVAGRDLGEEGLGRGHRDLRAGVGVEHGVRLARDGGAVGVDDRQDLGSLLTSVAQRLDRVHRLP